jgi:hypothetical protein
MMGSRRKALVFFLTGALLFITRMNRIRVMGGMIQAFMAIHLKSISKRFSLGLTL